MLCWRKVCGNSQSKFKHVFPCDGLWNSVGQVNFPDTVIFRILDLVLIPRSNKLLHISTSALMLIQPYPPLSLSLREWFCMRQAFFCNSLQLFSVSDPTATRLAGVAARLYPHSASCYHQNRHVHQQQLCHYDHHHAERLYHRSANHHRYYHRHHYHHQQ